MEETQAVAQTAATTAPPNTAARLEKLEQLLERQIKQSDAAARGRRLGNLLLLVLVAVVAAGLLWLNTTLQSSVEQLPELISTTTRSVQQLETTLQDVSSVDFEGLNNTIGEIGQSIETIDFETLNTSIEDLSQVVQALSNVTSIFR